MSDQEQEKVTSRHDATTVRMKNLQRARERAAEAKKRLALERKNNEESEINTIEEEALEMEETLIQERKLKELEAKLKKIELAKRLKDTEQKIRTYQDYVNQDIEELPHIKKLRDNNRSEADIQATISVAKNIQMTNPTKLESFYR